MPFVLLRFDLIFAAWFRLLLVSPFLSYTVLPYLHISRFHAFVWCRLMLTRLFVDLVTIAFGALRRLPLFLRWYTLLMFDCRFDVLLIFLVLYDATAIEYACLIFDYVLHYLITFRHALIILLLRAITRCLSMPLSQFITTFDYFDTFIIFYMPLRDVFRVYFDVFH